MKAALLCIGSFKVDASTSSTDESPIEEENLSGLKRCVTESVEDVFLSILRLLDVFLCIFRFLVSATTSSLDESTFADEIPRRYNCGEDVFL